jgi:hypothetical protein|tara:strand:+ start:518 stop:913 length:396 start_codon:yes stop_codon:yes gene_type:complete
MRKYFYFRTEAAVGDDDDVATSVMFPVENLVGMFPTSDTALTITFIPVLRNESDGQDGNVANNDTVILNVNTNAHREVMFAIANAANASASTKDGVISVADDATDDNNAAAVYLHNDITSCGAISIAAVLS